MPVALFLNDQQLDVFNAAVKGKSIEFKTSGRGNVQLTAENWEAIREAVKELHNTKFNIRTKTVDHMETCYYAQQVLEKISNMENELKAMPPVNDNTIGIVTTPEEVADKLATEEEEAPTPVEAVEEATPPKKESKK
jgi:hypothetical protein